MYQNTIVSAISESRGWGLGRGGRNKDENEIPVGTRVQLLKKMGLGIVF